MSEEPEIQALGKGIMIETIATLAAYGFILVVGIFVTAAQVMNLQDRRKRSKR